MTNFILSYHDYIKATILRRTIRSRRVHRADASVGWRDYSVHRKSPISGFVRKKIRYTQTCRIKDNPTSSAVPNEIAISEK